MPQQTWRRGCRGRVVRTERRTGVAVGHTVAPVVQCYAATRMRSLFSRRDENRSAKRRKRDDSGRRPPSPPSARWRRWAVSGPPYHQGISSSPRRTSNFTRGQGRQWSTRGPRICSRCWCVVHERSTTGSWSLSPSSPPVRGSGSERRSRTFPHYSGPELCSSMEKKAAAGGRRPNLGPTCGPGRRSWPCYASGSGAQEPLRCTGPSRMWRRPWLRRPIVPPIVLAKRGVIGGFLHVLK